MHTDLSSAPNVIDIRLQVQDDRSSSVTERVPPLLAHATDNPSFLFLAAHETIDTQEYRRSSMATHRSPHGNPSRHRHNPFPHSIHSLKPLYQPLYPLLPTRLPKPLLALLLNVHKRHIRPLHHKHLPRRNPNHLHRC